MKVLVIGGNGFIGSHLQDALLQAGYRVRVLDRALEKHRAPLPDVEYSLGSLADPTVLTSALCGVEAVIYLATTSVPSTSNGSVGNDIEANLLPFVSTLDAIVGAGVSRIIYLSSGGTVYGAARQGSVNEDAPTEPICSYGVVKLACEKYLGMYQRLHNIHPVVLRASNVFGPREGREGIQGFVGTSLMRLRRGESLEIWGDGSVVRDYLYVEDLARAVLLALDCSATGPINVGSGEGRSLLQVVDTIATVIGSKPNVRFLAPRVFDVPQIVLDIGRARDNLGWSPKIPFAEGVALHWRWVRGD